MPEGTDRYNVDQANFGARLEERLRAIEQKVEESLRRNPLRDASMTDGAFRILDGSGSDQQVVIGKQADGSYGIWSYDSAGNVVVKIADFAYVPVVGSYAAVGTDVVTAKVTGDAANRLVLNADGSVESGDGTAAPVLASFTRANSTAFGRGAGAVDASDTPTYLSAVGAYALFSNTTGSYNSAVGASALQENTTSSYNSAVGSSALRLNTTGELNSAVGAYALFSNTTGSYNSAVGSDAMRANTTGSYNSAVGVSALQLNTTGGYNSAVGVVALYSNTTGVQTSVVGAYALFSNTTGSYNSAVGAYALWANTTGSYNSAVGVRALYSPGGVSGNATTTGLRQTAVGAETGQASATQRNDIVCVGYRALVDGDNAIAIGSGASAGAAGAVAIGKDSANTSATTTTVDEIKLGTALHTVNIIGSALVGGSTTELVAFHGAPGVAQRAGAAQAAADTFAATQTTPWGFASAAQADGIVTLLNEIRATLVEKGIIKGAA